MQDFSGHTKRSSILIGTQFISLCNGENETTLMHDSDEEGAGTLYNRQLRFIR